VPLVESVSEALPLIEKWLGYLAFLEYGQLPSLGAFRQAIKELEALLVQRAQEIADLKAETEELRRFVEAVQEEASDREKPTIKFYGDDILGFYREMTARVVVDRDKKKHELRKATERAERAEALLTARAQEIEQVKAENERVRAALAEVPAPAKTTRQVIHERRAGIYAVIASLTTQEQRDAWGVSEDRPLYLNLTRVIDNLQKAAEQKHGRQVSDLCGYAGRGIEAILGSASPDRARRLPEIRARLDAWRANCAEEGGDQDLVDIFKVHSADDIAWLLAQFEPAALVSRAPQPEQE
jgi:hypothetical protein